MPSMSLFWSLAPSKEGLLQSQVEHVERKAMSHFHVHPTQSLREGDPCPWHVGEELKVTECCQEK